MTDQRPDPYQPPAQPFAPVEPSAPSTADLFDVTAPAVTPVRMTSGGSRALTFALGLAIVVGASGIAFAAGRATAPASTGAGANNPGIGQVNPQGNGPVDLFSNDPNGAPSASGRPNGVPGGDDNGGFGRGGFLGGPGGLSIQGTVVSTSPTSVTIKLATGQSVTFTLDATTVYHQQAAASASDIQAGKTIAVRLAGGFRPDDLGASGNGPITLGTAGDVTIVP